MSPLLCNGVIHPVFQIDGKVLLVILMLQMCDIIGMMVGPANFNILDVIPSVPQEDDGDRSLTTDATVRRSNSLNSLLHHEC